MRLSQTRQDKTSEADNSSTQSKWCFASLAYKVSMHASQPGCTMRGCNRTGATTRDTICGTSGRRSVPPCGPPQEPSQIHSITQLQFLRRVADRIAVLVESHTKLTVACRSFVIGILLRSKIDRTKSNSFNVMRPAPTDGATCRSHAFKRCLVLLQLLSMCAVL